MPNTFYLVSDKTARELSTLIRTCRDGKGRFIITEIGSDNGGWLTPDSWYLINNKKYKTKA